MAIAALTRLLAQARTNHPACLEAHQAMGAIVSCLSVPDTLTTADIIDLLLNDDEESAEQYLQSDASYLAQWDAVIAAIKTAIAENENFLSEAYPLADNAPSAALADWCDGYLQAYFYCETIWQEIFSTFARMDDQEGLEDAQENFEVLLKMISSFSNWKEALLLEPTLADFSEHIGEIHDDLFRGVNYYFHFGQDVAASWEAMANEPQQPYVSEIKIGRNDPCLCGSGKKYKHCCLN